MMDQRKIFQQMIEFQKKTLDNSFSAMVMLQKQGEDIVKTFIDQAAWLPQEGKKAIMEWLEAYSKGREQFMELVDTNFSKVQDFFEGVESKEATPSEQEVKTETAAT